MTAYKDLDESRDAMKGFGNSSDATSFRSSVGAGGDSQDRNGSLASAGNDEPKPSPLAEEAASVVLASLQPQLDSLRSRFASLEARVEEANKERPVLRAERLTKKPAVVKSLAASAPFNSPLPLLRFPHSRKSSSLMTRLPRLTRLTERQVGLTGWGLALLSMSGTMMYLLSWRIERSHKKSARLSRAVLGEQ